MFPRVWGGPNPDVLLEVGSSVLPDVLSETISAQTMVILANLALAQGHSRTNSHK